MISKPLAGLIILCCCLSLSPASLAVTDEDTTVLKMFDVLSCQWLVAGEEGEGDSSGEDEKVIEEEEEEPECD